MQPRTAAVAQGALLATSGLWPVIHLRSFEKVTGPKADSWLVKTVGLLLGTVGAVLLGAARRRKITREIALLGLGTSAALGAIDLRYAPPRRISRVYLVDALLQAAAIGLWIKSWRDGR